MDKTPRICISAGHGLGSRATGKMDSGAGIVTSSASEAEVTLAFSKRLNADFAALFAGRPGAFHMLRDTGVFYKADDDAARNACDTFIEIHTNAGAGKAKKDGREIGVEVFYEDTKDATFAKAMQRRLVAASGLPDRGAKRTTNLAVLQPHSGMRQVLVELFFGSDADDVAAYRAHHEAMELAIVNTCLATWGWREVKKLPRTWKPSSAAFYRLNWKG